MKLAVITDSSAYLSEEVRCRHRWGLLRGR